MNIELKEIIDEDFEGEELSVEDVFALAESCAKRVKQNIPRKYAKLIPMLVVGLLDKESVFATKTVVLKTTDNMIAICGAKYPSEMYEDVKNIVGYMYAQEYDDDLAERWNKFDNSSVVQENMTIMTAICASMDAFSSAEKNAGRSEVSIIGMAGESEPSLKEGKVENKYLLTDGVDESKRGVILPEEEQGGQPNSLEPKNTEAANQKQEPSVATKKQIQPKTSPHVGSVKYVPDASFLDIYFRSDNRIGRFQFAWRYITVFCASCVISTLLAGVSTSSAKPASMQILPYLLTFPFFISGITQMVRRAHDLNWSAAACLWAFIPVFNVIFMLFLFFKKGDDEPNKYGANPAAESIASPMLTENSSSKIDTEAHRQVNETESNGNKITDVKEVYGIVEKEIFLQYGVLLAEESDVMLVNLVEYIVSRELKEGNQPTIEKVGHFASELYKVGQMKYSSVLFTRLATLTYQMLEENSGKAESELWAIVFKMRTPNYTQNTNMEELMFSFSLFKEMKADIQK